MHVRVPAGCAPGSTIRVRLPWAEAEKAAAAAAWAAAEKIVAEKVP